MIHRIQDRLEDPRIPVKICRRCHQQRRLLDESRAPQEDVVADYIVTFKSTCADAQYDVKGYCSFQY